MTQHAMRVLITGGAGFIGSHLAEAHLEKGDEVYIIDDLSTGSLENIKDLQENEHFKNRLFVTVDSILNHQKLLELVGICHQVYHLAAAVGVLYVLEHPFESIRTNIQGTEKVLELSNKFKKRVVIASSSEVYGKHEHSPARGASPEGRTSDGLWRWKADPDFYLCEGCGGGPHGPHGQSRRHGQGVQRWRHRGNQHRGPGQENCRHDGHEVQDPMRSLRGGFCKGF